MARLVAGCKILAIEDQKRAVSGIVFFCLTCRLICMDKDLLLFLNRPAKNKIDILTSSKYNCLYGYKDIILVVRMDELVQCLRALSEEVRLRIIMLLTRGELCVCDIMEVLSEPQSKVSRHLSYLMYPHSARCGRSAPLTTIKPSGDPLAAAALGLHRAYVL
jgi:hypothetical protein